MKRQGGIFGRRRLLGGVLIGGAGAALAAACGGGGESDSSGSSSSGTGPALSGAATQGPQREPVRGGTLAFSIGGDPPSFDVHSQSTYLVSTLMAPVFSLLVRFKPSNVEESPDGIEGDLAKSYELSGDGLRYSFKLNEGVTFHDGKPFTSADVKASLERMMSPPRGVVSPRQDSLGVIDKIETPDATTTTLALKQPAPSLLPILA